MLKAILGVLHEILTELSKIRIVLEYIYKAIYEVKLK